MNTEKKKCFHCGEDCFQYATVLKYWDQDPKPGRRSQDAPYDLCQECYDILQDCDGETWEMHYKLWKKHKKKNEKKFMFITFNPPPFEIGVRGIFLNDLQKLIEKWVKCRSILKCKWCYEWRKHEEIRYTDDGEVIGGGLHVHMLVVPQGTRGIANIRQHVKRSKMGKWMNDIRSIVNDNNQYDKYNLYISGIKGKEEKTNKVLQDKAARKKIGLNDIYARQNSEMKKNLPMCPHGTPLAQECDQCQNALNLLTVSFV